MIERQKNKEPKTHRSEARSKNPFASNAFAPDSGKLKPPVQNYFKLRKNLNKER